MKPISFISALTASVLCLASATHACPSCFASSKAQALQAYYASVVFMALLPFGLVAGVLFWLRKRLQQNEQAQRGAGDSQA